MNRNFEKKLKKLFDIASRDGVSIVSKDRNRTRQDKAEDITFLADQRGERTIIFTHADVRYGNVVQTAELGEEAKEAAKEKE